MSECKILFFRNKKTHMLVLCSLRKCVSVAGKKCITIEVFGDLLAPKVLYTWKFCIQGENVYATSSEEIKKLDNSSSSSSHLRMKQN